jgi:hypothetical protein
MLEERIQVMVEVMAALLEAAAPEQVQVVIVEMGVMLPVALAPVEAVVVEHIKE